MKDIYKNPILYYVAVPVIVAIWPLLVWAVYLPETEHNWQKQKDQYDKGQKIIAAILKLDPERLDLTDSRAGDVEFSYATAVSKITGLCQIPPANCNINTKPIRVSSGQKSRGCQVVLSEVDVTKFARFLSAMKLRWANLQCEKVTLTKKKGLPDTWKIDIDFKYYY